MNPVGKKICKIDKKTLTFDLLILALLAVKKGLKISPLAAIIYIHLKVSLICLWSWMVPHEKLFDKMDKNFQKSQFWTIFVNQKSIKKLKAKNQNSNPQAFGQYCCAHSSQISERLDKNWGSLVDLKKVDRRWWTARHWISSADYVSSRAKKNPLNP